MLCVCWYDCMLYVKFVCVKLYVKFVCVLNYCCMCKEAGGGGREAEEKEPGIQNQKQEPHTKMWGKNRVIGEHHPKYW